MKRKNLLFAGCLGAGLFIANLALAQEAPVSTENADSSAIKFEAPVRLEVDGEPIRVEAPGYACPGMADMNGDGLKDLLVGQFAGGKIMVYHNDGNNGYKKGQWLKAEGAVAEIPGVW